MGRVEGKVAFVTGAARGQGRSHAVRLAEEGADIIAIDLCDDVPGALTPGPTLDDLAETVRQVEAHDRRIVAEKADIRDAEGLREVVDAGVAEFGRLDIIAANAGIATVAGPLLEADAQLWQDMLDSNLTGTWNTCRVAAPHIVAGGRGGAIVIISSVTCLQAYPNVGHYVAAKHGVLGLTRTLAVELGPESIRVNDIAPTQVATDMILNQKGYEWFAPDKENPTREDMAVVAEGMHMLPTPWVEPIDISNALVFLASDEGRYITATTLTVDAGASQH